MIEKTRETVSPCANTDKKEVKVSLILKAFSEVTTAIKKANIFTRTYCMLCNYLGVSHMHICVSYQKCMKAVFQISALLKG